MFPDGIGFYPDIQNGERGYNTDAARGADTFYPFSTDNDFKINVTVTAKTSGKDGDKNSRTGTTSYIYDIVRHDGNISVTKISGNAVSVGSSIFYSGSLSITGITINSFILL